MSSIVWIPSGSHRVIYEYANNLVRLGHEINIVFPISKSKSKLSLSSVRKRIVTLSPSWFDLDSSVRLIRISYIDKKFFPATDVIFAANWDTVDILHSNFSRSNVRLFQFVHHYEVLTGHDAERVNSALQKPIPKIAVSSWTKELIEEKGFKNIHLVQNGVDEKRFRIIRSIESRPLSICMSFIQKPIKDHETGLQVLDLIKEEFPDITIHLLGASRFKPRLKFKYKYHYRVSESYLIKEVYNDSRLFLCTSKYEGFSFPQIEAMACGCAVISTNCGGNRDFAIHNRSALIASVGNIIELTNHTVELLKNEVKRLELVHESQKIIKNFSWQESSSRLMNVINES